MTETRHVKLLIVGSGPAGYTAAVYGAPAPCWIPLLIQGIQPGGQLTITTDVENWPGDASVLGPDLMVRMEAHARETGAEVVSDHVSSIDLSVPPLPPPRLDSGGTVTADAVILATGAQAKWLGLPSEEAFKGFGVSACATCDGFFYRGKEVVVVGGGNTAVEEALFLTNFAAKVTLVHRRDALRAERILQDRLFKHPKVEVIWDHVPRRGAGRHEPPGASPASASPTARPARRGRSPAPACSSPSATRPPASSSSRTSSRPNHGRLRRHEPLTATATSIPGVFAAGDLTDPHLPPGRHQRPAWAAWPRWRPSASSLSTGRTAPVPSSARASRSVGAPRSRRRSRPACHATLRCSIGRLASGCETGQGGGDRSAPRLRTTRDDPCPPPPRTSPRSPSST